MKILVVDDEKIVGDFLKRFLSLDGNEVKVVESGFQAIEAAEKEDFAVVFLDVRMPGMDGIEALQKLKKILPIAKYIIMTGYALDELLSKAEKEYGVTCIKKPFDTEQITALLKKEV